MSGIIDLAGYCFSQSKAFNAPQCLTPSRGHSKHEAGLRFNIFLSYLKYFVLIRDIPFSLFYLFFF